MENGEAERDQPVEIPEDATVVRPSSWAWGMWVVPMVVFVVVSVSFDFISFGLLPLIMAMVLVVPRYFGWRGTQYILTDEHVVVRRGSGRGGQSFDLAFSLVGEVAVRPGMFGRGLGYAAVHLRLKDGRVAALDHVPLDSGLIEHVRARIDSTPLPEEDEPEG